MRCSPGRMHWGGRETRSTPKIGKVVNSAARGGAAAVDAGCRTDRRHCPLDSPRRLGFDGAMYAVPKPGYGPETMRAVAAAYRRERRLRILHSKEET